MDILILQILPHIHQERLHLFDRPAQHLSEQEQAERLQAGRDGFVGPEAFSLVSNNTRPEGMRG